MVAGKSLPVTPQVCPTTSHPWAKSASSWLTSLETGDQDYVLARLAPRKERRFAVSRKIKTAHLTPREVGSLFRLTAVDLLRPDVRNVLLLVDGRNGSRIRKPAKTRKRSLGNLQYLLGLPAVGPQDDELERRAGLFTIVRAEELPVR